MSKDAEGFKYEVIAKRIKDAIREGQLQENDRIPGEIELAQQFMASRITVRKAMELLESERLVYKIREAGPMWPEKRRTAQNPVTLLY